MQTDEKENRFIVMDTEENVAIAFFKCIATLTAKKRCQKNVNGLPIINHFSKLMHKIRITEINSKKESHNKEN